VPESVEAINDDIVVCRLCPRLIEWREAVALEKRKSFQDWDYWGRPVPAFGDFDANRLIVGLAPAAHGANRTGRMFTGDRSGDWLYRALYKAGVASQPTSEWLEDGLTLKGVLITASAHCAPPDNKPTTEELDTCRRYLARILALRKWDRILCLGGIAWNNVLKTLGEKRKPKFGHGALFETSSGTTIVGAYHPSQQNTFTGRLTESMLDDAVRLFLEA
jgi:uracil-DNA glycosylase family 4